MAHLHTRRRYPLPGETAARGHPSFTVAARLSYPNGPIPSKDPTWTVVLCCTDTHNPVEDRPILCLLTTECLSVAVPSIPNGNYRNISHHPIHAQHVPMDILAAVYDT